MAVPAGTPVKVALDRELRIRNVGQQVHGKVVEPVYSFDTLVVPAGTEVTGKVAAIEPVSKKIRIMSGMNANFSPAHKVQLQFDQLILPDGRCFPMQTSVSMASNGVLEFVPAGAQQKRNAVGVGKNRASREIHQLQQDLKRKWADTKTQLHEPGKMHRLERYALEKSPYHPQYMNPGTSFNADLLQPLDFGNEAFTPRQLSSIGNPPPSGSVVHALLVTPLSSATSREGDRVEAVISQPLVVSNQLFIPQGSHLKGSVLQARPARRLNRSGQLRIVFHELVPPSGLQQKIEASIEGVEVAQGEHLALDSEGGAQVTAPKTRYLTTGIEVALATSSAGDEDRGRMKSHGGGGGNVGSGAANGASGFQLIGSLAGALSHSRMFSTGLGFYGAGMSAYSHFLSRGQEVVYPKDMSMVVGFGTRDTAATKPPSTH